MLARTCQRPRGLGLWMATALVVGNLGGFNPSAGSLFGSVTAAALTLWAFIGLESATVPAEDVADPKRTIPRSTIIGTLVTALVSSWGRSR